MDLELATTHDILVELHRRHMHFAFVGMELGNRPTGNAYYACYGPSRSEILRMLRALQVRLRKGEGPDLGADGGRTT